MVDIPRNMPDWLLKKMAAKGGVIGFEIGNDFIAQGVRLRPRTEKDILGYLEHPEGGGGHDDLRGGQAGFARVPRVGPNVPDSVRITVDGWVGVVDQAIQLVGEDHVAIGTDFDGGPKLPRGMRDTRDLPMITEAMVRRGYSEERIDKFWGGNLLRLFRQVTQKHG